MIRPFAPSRLLLAAPLIAVLAVGCEPEPDVEPLACRKPEPAQAEIGEGDIATGFLPLAEGGDLPVVLGPQGLHMVVVSVRLSDFEMPSAVEQTSIEVAVQRDDDVVAGMVDQIPPSARDDDMVEYLGLRATFMVEEVKPLAGESASVVVTVRDGCGREIRAAREVKLVL